MSGIGSIAQWLFCLAQASSQSASAENQALRVEIAAIYTESGETYGSPRIHTELVDRGRVIGKNRVARLMRAEKIGVFPKKRRPSTTNSKHDYPIAPNLLKRAFQADHPNEKWLGDITYIRTREGGLYLAASLDMFSRKLVGWALDDNLESQLVKKAFLRAAHLRKPPKGLLHHADRGSQYARDVYQACLADYNIQVSMSRTGHCYDNDPMDMLFYL